MKRVVVDWGTSNFRAYRFASDGTIAEKHQAAAGILGVEDGAFEAVLLREIGAWIDHDTEVFLSGMITSRNGWLETPYIEAPAGLDALAANARSGRLASGARLRFMPGVCIKAPSPDVMRGEEIQVFGSLAPDESVTMILPGTHSKWVRVEAGRLTDFRTFFTGELFSVLKAHSILGRLIPESAGPLDEAAFRAGVIQANQPGSAGLLHEIFTARSGVLLGDFGPDAIAERLSGILIGAEIAGGIALGWANGTLRLVGDAALCGRYRIALDAVGLHTEFGPAEAAVEGFRRLSALEGETV